MRLKQRLCFRLGSQECTFRLLVPEDVTEEYVAALRNQRAYLSSNPPSITVDWQKEYVRKILDSEADTICGLFADHELVGTSGIQGICKGGVPTIGIFVLDPAKRGRGYGKSLVWAASTLVRACSTVERVEAGMEFSNAPSLRAFLACGFSILRETQKGYRVGLLLSGLRQPESISDVQLDTPQLQQVDAVLACRLEGTRLYGKPMQLIDIQNGITILENLVRHFEGSPWVRSINLAIADEKENCVIADLAERRGWPFVIGDPKDVLGRILKAVEAFGIETVLRATTECPFIYYEGIDDLLHSHFDGNYDYSMYRHLPEGAGFSLISARALDRSHREGEARHRSELVTSYIFDHQESFRLNIRDLPESLGRPEVRVTVDYPEDLVFCRKVYRDLEGARRLIPLQEIIRYWDDNEEARKPLENIGVDWGHGRLWR